MYRGLLFSLIAIRNDLLSLEQLMASFQEWILKRSIMLDDILVDHAVLTDRQRRTLWPLVDLILEKNEGDEARTLSSLAWAAPIRDALLPLTTDAPEVSKVVATIGQIDLLAYTMISTDNSQSIDPWGTLPQHVVDDPFATLDWGTVRSNTDEEKESQNGAQSVKTSQDADTGLDPHATLLGLDSKSSG